MLHTNPSRNGRIPVLGRLHNHLMNIFQRAESYKFTHSKICDELSQFYRSMDFIKQTRADRAYMFGYVEAKFEAIWKYEVEWKHYYKVDGKLYTIAEFRDKGLLHSEVDTELSNYFWKGTEKPFATKVDRSIKGDSRNAYNQ